MEILPSEIISNIFQYLAYKDAKNFGLTQRRIYNEFKIGIHRKIFEEKKILEKELFSKCHNSRRFDGIGEIYIKLKQFDKAEKICSAEMLARLYEKVNEMSKAEEAWKKHGSERLLAQFYERWYKRTNKKEYLDKAEQAWKENSDNLASFYERCYKITSNEKYMKNAEQAWKENNEKYELASFYERWYKKTNSEECMKKAEQIWKERSHKISLANFYERWYEITNNEEYLDKAEQQLKEDSNKRYLAEFYKRLERWDECLIVLIKDILGHGIS